MNPQVPLPFGPVRRPAATADPETSNGAAIEAQATGLLGRQKMETLRALRDWPLDPPTSAELSRGDTTLRFRYARRLADLELHGLVEKCPARVCRRTERVSVTWRLTESGRWMVG